MAKSNLVSDTTLQSTGKWAFLLFALCLPLSTKVSNGFLILALVLTLIWILTTPGSKRPRLPSTVLGYTSLSLFVLILLGIAYTENISDAPGHIERSISFLLCPLVLYFSGIFFVRAVLGYLHRGLLIGVGLCAVYLLTLNLHNYFSSQQTLKIGAGLFDYYHTNKYFTEPVDIHPNYLGVYILTALLYLGENIKKIGIKIAVFLLLGITIVFLNSRSIFACTALIFLFFAIKSGLANYRRHNLKQFCLRVGAMAALLLSISFLLSKTFIGYRIKNVFKVDLSTNSVEKANSQNTANPRLARWNSVIDLIGEKPIFGYGTAAEKEVLQKRFYQDGLEKAADERYDSHNQFLGYGVRFGMIGLLTLLFFFFGNLRLATISKNHRYALLVITVFMVCLVENYLDRNFGITYVAIFFTTLSMVSYGLDNSMDN